MDKPAHPDWHLMKENAPESEWTYGSDVEWEPILCDECQREIEFLFMLKNDIWWGQLDLSRELLCVACTETHLGRPLLFNDFNFDVSCNKEVLYGYLLCLRTLRHHGVI